jgi:hypothetical protein
MQNLFRDIIVLPGVRGVLLISFKGEILYESFQPTDDRPPLDRDWHRFLETLADVNEVDLAFADGRLYARRTPRGFIIIVSSQFAQSAMIRLHCDILLPELAKAKIKKKKRFFRR